MRHGLKRNKLNRAKDQQKALMRTLARELIIHGQIRTTLPKAKVLRIFVEKVLTKAIKAVVSEDVAVSLHNTRQVASAVFPDIVSTAKTRASKLKERKGGYTRILKLGARKSDQTPMAIIQILDQD